MKKEIGDTKVIVHGQIRLLEVEDRVRAQKAKEGENEEQALRGMLDKDDIMKRLAEHLDEERFMKMFSLFYAVISKESEDKSVVFQCKSVESDIIIEYAFTMPTSDIEDFIAVAKTANAYRGVESMMLDENYRTGLYEYLVAHTVDEDFVTLVEHLSVVLHSMSIEETNKRLKDFAFEGLKQ